MNTTPQNSDVLLGDPITCTPRRRRILLRLARADGQPWTEDQRGSGWNDHMAEVMFGKAADIVDEIAAEQYGAVVAHLYSLPNPGADELLALIDPDAVRRHNKRVWWQGFNAAERTAWSGAKTIPECPYDRRHRRG